MDDSAVAILRAEDWIKNPYPVQVMIRIHDRPMTFHRHDFFEFVFVSRGTMTHIIDGHATILVPGDLFLIVPGEAMPMSTLAMPSFTTAFLPPWPYLRTIVGNCLSSVRCCPVPHRLSG